MQTETAASARIRAARWAHHGSAVRQNYRLQFTAEPKLWAADSIL